MAFTDRPYAASFSRSGMFPQVVRWLLISNIGLFILYFFATLAGYGGIFEPFGLVPADLFRRLAIWQPITYMFLHDPTGFGHILFNMLTLWMFGADLERTWGSRRFLNYYLLCGVGAALCVIVANFILPNGNPFTRTIGASGAIYGLLLAFGMLYPDRQILFSFLFPIKAKYFVMILGAIAFLSSFDSRAGGVSHVAHLGGMIFGYFYLKSQLARRRSSKSFDPIGAWNRWYHEYKLQRARRKFQVYLRKSDKDRIH